jgi:SAM-dependent methyltransferase
MSPRKIIARLLNRAYRRLDGLYLPLDQQRLRRTRNIRLIPQQPDRRGGKLAYAEWAHVIGIFQSLICQNLPYSEGNRILDIGCGTGLLGIASEPYVSGGGQYTGIDVMLKDVEFCRAHYPPETHRFIHFNLNNPAYARAQDATLRPWPVPDADADLVTALSVWTHLNERDAVFYFAEIARVLKPGGRAIITFFLLDEAYRNSIAGRKRSPGRFHMTPQTQWIFNRPSYGSDAWFHPGWAKVPERAIGVTRAGLERLLNASGMELERCYPGNWKETAGLYFQDVLIFRKS